MRIINIKNKLLQQKNGIYLFSLLFFFIFSCNDSSSPSVDTNYFNLSQEKDSASLGYGTFTLATITTTAGVTNGTLTLTNINKDKAAYTTDKIKINVREGTDNLTGAINIEARLPAGIYELSVRFDGSKDLAGEMQLKNLTFYYKNTYKC